MTAAVVSKGFAVEDHIMVSPPAGFMSFDSIAQMPSTGLVITGDRDDIAPVDVIQGHLSRWKISPEFAIIKNCDHFYSGCLGKLKTLMAEYLST
jgi:hypothetical protein